MQRPSLVRHVTEPSARRSERGDDRARGPGFCHQRSSTEIDSSDGDQRTARSARLLRGEAEFLQADHRVRIHFRPRGEHWPIRHIGRLRGQTGPKLPQVVRGHADEQPRGDAAHLGDWQVLLTHVDPVAVGHHGEIRAVVGKQKHARPGAERSQGPEQRQGVAGRDVLGAKLQLPRPGLQDLCCELEHGNTLSSERVYVDDGVEPSHVLTFDADERCDTPSGMRWAPRSAILLAAAFTLVAAGPSHAQPTPASDEATQPSAPSPLDFQVAELGPRQPWSLAITNRSEHPVELVADPRLLWFEVIVPGKRKPEICRLPSELFPDRAQRRHTVLLGPQEAVVHSFDPRLYCFSKDGQWRLVPGALVTPHFGWPEKTKTTWKRGKRVEVKVPQKEPFVAQVIESAPEGASQLPANQGDGPHAEGQSIKEVQATPFALVSAYAEWARTRLERKEQEQEGPFQLKLTAGSDAEEERTATVRMSIKNRDKRAHHLYIRRELFSFEVTGPDGMVSCDPEPDYRAPDPQAFFNMAPGRTVSLSSRLVELCPRGTFARPGLYLIHARMDPNQRGREFDLDAYVGRIVSYDPASVRIRTGERKRMAKRPAMRRIIVEPAGE